MSTFAVKVTRIKAIEPIPNADVIELAVVGDYRSVIKKDQYKAGDVAIYIPEGSIVPHRVLEALGLVGKLAGSEKNRVKAIKLRGCLSQGILFPVKPSDLIGPMPYMFELTTGTENTFKSDTWYVQEGEDVAANLGITKYEPPIPAYMTGEQYYAGTEITVNFDIENFKGFPEVLQDGEEVIFTEKLHGTFCGIGIVPIQDANDKHWENRIVVFSKGLGAQGICFRSGERSEGNVYIRALRKNNVFNILRETIGDRNEPVFVFGEVFGTGVQDLSYGEKELEFRVFNMASGYRANLTWWNYDSVKTYTDSFGLKMVPLVYRGPFSKEVMLQHTAGLETVSGNKTHMREGIVITPVKERRDPTLGRVILKSVSETYLLRKTANATEYT